MNYKIFINSLIQNLCKEKKNLESKSESGFG